MALSMYIKVIEKRKQIISNSKISCQSVPVENLYRFMPKLCMMKLTNDKISRLLKDFKITEYRKDM